MPAWRGWYHVNGNTYGTWLPGDPRGWRARHHKEHVEGDYRNPPPAGLYEGLHTRAQVLMRGDEVHLTEDQRRIAGQAVVAKLCQLDVEPIALSVGAVHYHVLARFLSDDVRRLVGLAKKHAWFALRDIGFSGTLWAKGCRVLPVRDRAHQVNVYGYICRHAQEGAWVWTYDQGLYWRANESPPTAVGGK